MSADCRFTGAESKAILAKNPLIDIVLGCGLYLAVKLYKSSDNLEY
jgi:hypothetical protein